jgi:hypothetical protein
MPEPEPYGGGLTFAYIDRILADHRAAYAPPITEFKITQDQLDQLRRTVPMTPALSPASTLFGIPVILVDTDEESTLFNMRPAIEPTERCGFLIQHDRSVFAGTPGSVRVSKDGIFAYVGEKFLDEVNRDTDEAFVQIMAHVLRDAARARARSWSTD